MNEIFKLLDKGYTITLEPPRYNGEYIMTVKKGDINRGSGIIMGRRAISLKEVNLAEYDVVLASATECIEYLLEPESQKNRRISNDLSIARPIG